VTLAQERRRTAVEAEDAFAQLAERWEVHRNGWPDFLCIVEGQPITVEVKSGNGRLTKEQCEVMNVLASSGISCYVWHPDQGLTLYQQARRPKITKVETTRVVKMEPYSEVFSDRVMEEHRRVTGRGLTSPRARS
jgi:hypothetical protein